MEKNIKVRISSDYCNKYIIINEDQFNFLDWLGEHGFLNITYVEEGEIEYEVI